jgi:DNA polymerase III epsilon subunit-like protein
VHRVVVIHVEGLTATVALQHSAALRGLTSRFAVAHPAKLAGNAQFVYDVGHSLLQCQLSPRERKDAIRAVTKKHFRELVLTASERAEHGYPPAAGGDGWVILPSRSADDTSGTSHAAGERMVAVDCEMVVTEAGRELARCTVVDDAGAVLYDALVLPSAPVTDYVTQYSGITADMLNGVTHSLSDVHDDLCRLLRREDVLVGHSLENDLQALHLAHALVIDTAVIFGRCAFCLSRFRDVLCCPHG